MELKGRKFSIKLGCNECMHYSHMSLQQQLIHKSPTALSTLKRKLLLPRPLPMHIHMKLQRLHVNELLTTNVALENSLVCILMKSYQVPLKSVFTSVKSLLAKSTNLVRLLTCWCHRRFTLITVLPLVWTHLMSVEILLRLKLHMANLAFILELIAVHTSIMSKEVVTHGCFVIAVFTWKGAWVTKARSCWVTVRSLDVLDERLLVVTRLTAIIANRLVAFTTCLIEMSRYVQCDGVIWLLGVVFELVGFKASFAWETIGALGAAEWKGIVVIALHVTNEIGFVGDVETADLAGCGLWVMLGFGFEGFIVVVPKIEVFWDQFWGNLRFLWHFIFFFCSSAVLSNFLTYLLPLDEFFLIFFAWGSYETIGRKSSSLSSLKSSRQSDLWMLLRGICWTDPSPL